MTLLGMLILILMITGFIQIWLSTRRNNYFGIIIPVANIIIATLIVMMTSDLFVALYVLMITLSPLIIWFGIYKIFRQVVKNKIKANINLMKIKDMR